MIKHTDYIIREYQKADIPRLIHLWQSAFHDNDEFMQAFFDALPGMGSGMVAAAGDNIIGAAYTICAQELLSPGVAPVPLGYIYGVAVDEEYRSQGVGAAVCRAAYGLSKKLGAEKVCLMPAEEGLSAWYNKILGLKPVLRRKSELIPATAAEKCQAISSGEYLEKREHLLRDYCHVRLSGHALEFEKNLLRAYGGDLLAMESGIAAACLDGERAIIRELICPGDLREHCASSAAAALGSKEALLFTPDKDAEVYILSDGEIAEDCIWNLIFE